ncbi:MAG TPA: NADH-quinone oxidoreductase subunit NuoE [Anaerolineae bacterium]|nr:NADH-quinone oxidoreductase subunit NuoE [Anaerolineae bacterium]HQI87602.1 NADH-quinone oxidoreductase subunit NuoE [Anaerolineae bacterium]
MEKNTTEIVRQIITRYDNDREALVEILREISQELTYLSQETLTAVADALRLPYSHVYSVASFYSMLNLEPRGRHVIKFCHDAPCHVAGGREIWETLEHELGIPFGATTPDGAWTLLPTSCIGACSVGPVMLVDDEIYGNLTPDRVREIITQVGGDA